ncbi:MAG: bifunctional [glutamate--ammonia ligase]-adenylyl-L-tyrosine phosphorylase/[glutamate--ammonia-ligase] adenylyltransferase [Gammaproteobacteria bacterium]
MQTQITDPNTWPTPARVSAQASFAQLEEGAPQVVTALAKCGLLEQARAVVAVSRYALGVMIRQPDALVAAIAQGRLSTPTAPALDNVEHIADADEFANALRQMRDREMFLIAWHDLGGQRATEDTLTALSVLARLILAMACARLVARRGDVPEPMIIGMGKLGGGELNFSSDIDLVFVHPDGADAQAYLKLARELIALLDERTAFGLVYRVDVRLRPFGRTGALSLSLSAFEHYLHTHARDWERYAYLKAAVLTGSAEDRAALTEVLRSFVYRRYLDFGVLESLRHTKSLIEADVERNTAGDDIKRGEGGIREIEFIAQSLQVLRGGRQRALQTTSLIDALGQLEALEWLDNNDRATLMAAYLYLRHVENRLQMRRDQQTHVLPDDAAARFELAAAMGVDVASFDATLAQHREKVALLFGELLRPEDAVRRDSAAAQLWSHAQNESESAQAPTVSDERDAALRANLQALAASRTLARLDSQGRERLDRLVPQLLELVTQQPDPVSVMTRVSRVLEGVGRRSAYFALLNEHRQARERLVSLCAVSQRVASDVADQPLLLDSLIDLDVEHLPTHAARQAQLGAALHGIAPDDQEVMTDALAQFKSAAEFEVAVADLTSQLPVMKVSDHLTSIAQSVITQVLQTARFDIEHRYGRLPCAEVSFCVVAYGKLGGLELGYGSDLDLVFLYDVDDDQCESDGKRALAPPVYFARLVQRVVHLATATTRGGKLYEVDTRLRPSGNSGPLVSRLAAYAGYQEKSAWTWEHQALLRARAVAGDDHLATRFDDVRRGILCRQRDSLQLKADVLTMRKRMAAANPVVAGTFHVKHDPGGLTDVEFLVQIFLLAHAHALPELVQFSDHMRQLDALIETGCLGANVGEDLQAIYLAYRTHLHRRALDDGNVRQEAAAMGPERARIRAIWREVFG